MSDPVFIIDKSIDKSINDRLREHYLDAMRYNIFGNTPIAPAPPVWTDDSAGSIYTIEKLMRMLVMRLHLPEGQRIPFDFATAYKFEDKKVFVFLVHNGEPVVLEDEWPMYPSDALVTKLRLIMG